jgi:hypothetical protein
VRLVTGEGGRRSCDVCDFFPIFCTLSLISSLLIVTHLSPLVAFKVYDMDRDGYISNGELFLVLKMMVGNNLKVNYYLPF